MVEFIVAHWLVMLNIYLIGYVISLVISLVMSGMNDEDPEGLVVSNLTWFLDVFHLIGLGILILTKKGKK